MAAAVADYRPEQAADQKLKKHGQNLVLSLQQNPDILASVGAGRSATGKPILVGFAVETGDKENLLSEARRKLEKKNADLIVANFAVDAFDKDTNRVWIVDKQGRQEEISTARKSAIAETILDAVARLT
jgi:phosphopantothenoylcysteine decarboxylase/phosphopantothenate--cysteine ligase